MRSLSKRKLSLKNTIRKLKKMAGSSKSISPSSKSISLKSNKSINDLTDEELVPKNINIKRQIYVSPQDLLNPIGILDPDGKNNNPLTNQPYQNLYPKTYVQQAENFWSKLPMYHIREEAIKAKEIKAQKLRAIETRRLFVRHCGSDLWKLIEQPQFFHQNR